MVISSVMKNADWFELILRAKARAAASKPETVNSSEISFICRQHHGWPNLYKYVIWFSDAAVGSIWTSMYPNSNSFLGGKKPFSNISWKWVAARTFGLLSPKLIKYSNNPQARLAPSTNTIRLRIELRRERANQWTLSLSQTRRLSGGFG